LNGAEAIGGHAEGRSGNAELKGKIEIKAAKKGGGVEIVVEDDGPGLPADVIEHVFDPFFTTKHTGTGLGLAIVHRIVEAHGGTIVAENIKWPGRGARFRIVI
jgi:two-component system, NtrC family, nitrogen regulation sensor histidine kinase NtrY